MEKEEMILGNELKTLGIAMSGLLTTICSLDKR